MYVYIYSFFSEFEFWIRSYYQFKNITGRASQNIFYLCMFFPIVFNNIN